MKLKEMVQEMEDSGFMEDLTKKRFACAHCGSIWTEFVGLVTARSKQGDFCLQIGMEREDCRKCGLRARECQKCGSRDVYEVGLVETVT
jgi:hypothetical protein